MFSDLHQQHVSIVVTNCHNIFTDFLRNSWQLGANQCQVTLTNVLSFCHKASSNGKSQP
jgi:hypothetical protein